MADLFQFAGPLNDHVVPMGYLNKDGDYVFTLATQKNADALDALYRIPYQEGWTGEVLGYDYMTARAAFGQGNVGMFRIGAYMMIVYDLQYPDLNYGIADLPKIDPNGAYVEAGQRVLLVYHQAGVRRQSRGGGPGRRISRESASPGHDGPRGGQAGAQPRRLRGRGHARLPPPSERHHGHPHRSAGALPPKAAGALSRHRAL